MAAGGVVRVLPFVAALAASLPAAPRPCPASAGRGVLRSPAGHREVAAVGRASHGVERAPRRAALMRVRSLFGKAQPARGSIITPTLRISMASLVNTIVDIPLIGEMEEQVIFTKIVDAVADLLEQKIVEAMGEDIETVSAELEAMDQDEVDAWRDGVVDKLNGQIDVPILNEEQEAPIIRFIVDKFLDASLKKGYVYGGKKKLFGIF